MLETMFDTHAKPHTVTKNYYNYKTEKTSILIKIQYRYDFHTHWHQEVVRLEMGWGVPSLQR
jgi:hypothetical protein